MKNENFKKIKKRKRKNYKRRNNHMKQAKTKLIKFLLKCDSSLIKETLKQLINYNKKKSFEW